ncbi:MAG: hypothetical protein AAGD96_05260 [Chloroflexota bacterium]
MKQNANLNLKYTKIFPVFLLLCCVPIFWATLVAGFSSSTITGLILLLIAVLSFTKEIIVIKPKSIEWKNMFGRTMKTLSYDLDEIEVRENKVFVGDEKILGLWMYDQSADTVIQHFEQLTKS